MKAVFAIILTIIILQAGLFPLELSRFVFTRDIKDNEPADSDTVFFLIEDTVFCFTEFQDVQKTTRIFHKWFCNNRAVATIPLTIQPSKRWRTWTKKAFKNCTGEWLVRICDQRDKIIAEKKFLVKVK
jgi:hypothetical protein